MGSTSGHRTLENYTVAPGEGHDEEEEDHEHAALLSMERNSVPVPSKKRKPWFVWPLLLAALMAVSSAGTVFDEMPLVPPIILAAWRTQLTTVFLLPGFIWQLRAMGPAERVRTFRSCWLLALSGTCLGGQFGFWVWGLQHTSLAHSLLLVCCAPVIMAAWALIMRQPISLYEILGTLFAFIGGAVLALGGSAKGEQDIHLSGDASSLFAAVLVVGYFLIGGSLRKWMPLFVYAFPVTGVAALLLSVVGAIVNGPHWLFAWMFTRQYTFWVLYLAICPGLVGHTGFNMLLGYLSTLTIGLAFSLEALVGSLIGWLAGVASPPGPSTLIGGGMLLGATMVVTWASGRREAEAALLESASGRPAAAFQGKGRAGHDEGGVEDEGEGLLQAGADLNLRTGSLSDMTALLTVCRDLELGSFHGAGGAQRVDPPSGRPAFTAASLAPSVLPGEVHE